jgi:hypothetical protein
LHDLKGIKDASLPLSSSADHDSQPRLQTEHVNPWSPVNVAPLPPIASLSDGVWLKGDLHLHSRHSKDSSNHSEAKIIGFAESVGMDYLAITDHDNQSNADAC